ncbi:hypothetical protein [Streptomyces ochraceiscleroticus]|uniref:Uncharacterized protein n=1 Tax=Streptomyces ochraceiscleroticus TaxID=47761 RepID=A0ABW1MRA3_9ACTN|nr:hypothetical protein [Streptomyces ochraceiscleroticus]
MRCARQDVAGRGEPVGLLAEVDLDMAVNIEHEDAAYSRTEGLALAAKDPGSCGGEPGFS